MNGGGPLDRIGLSSHSRVPDSTKRFADGAEFRLEIPSVEGPHVLNEVIGAAEHFGITINRVSQGSGGMLLTGAELREMAVLGANAGLEIALFIGPRGGWDTGAFSRSPSGAGQHAAIRGRRQLTAAIKDVQRSVEAGIRSFLIADVGLLTVLADLQRDGSLPPDVIWKFSAYMAPANPATLLLLERLEAGTVNLPSDLSFEELADMRSVVDLPLDVYLETPESMGGIVRGHEIADFVRVGAPIYIKMGLHNSPGLYPFGGHLLEQAKAIGREKVHRAAIALEWLARERPQSIQSKPHAAGLAIPVAEGAPGGRVTPG